MSQKEIDDIICIISEITDATVPVKKETLIRIIEVITKVIAYSEKYGRIQNNPVYTHLYMLLGFIKPQIDYSFLGWHLRNCTRERPIVQYGFYEEASYKLMCLAINMPY
jgi:hypothetical protein